MVSKVPTMVLVTKFDYITTFTYIYYFTNPPKSL